ncbi:MAG: hypothetical protein OXN25_21620 [Candidatus Poribacteria bacterium]|nr:hypothetical protein [Candidatus Poribacteria bacterium]
MKTLHQSLKHSLVENVKDKKTSNTTDEVSMLRGQGPDMTTTRNNPKIDTELLSEFHRLAEEYERLTAPLKDIARVTQGADYNIAHPLARKDMPTDAYHLGKNVSKVEKS